jgi:hypothetical protein
MPSIRRGLLRTVSALKLFAFFAGASFTSGAAIYFLLRFFTRWAGNGQTVFGGLFRMYMYHEKHPLQYIGLVALVYGFLAAGCASYRPRLQGRVFLRTYLLIVGATVVLASIPGGVLWTIHDMQAGYFPEGSRFWTAIWDGVSGGLSVGWLVVLISFPCNILAVAAGYPITKIGFALSLHYSLRIGEDRRHSG